MLKEGQEQRFLFQWANQAIQFYPELELLHHIPNGGKRDIKTAISLKRQGVKPGVPDIFLPVARGQYHGLYIELKVNDNTTTEKQQRFIELLRDQNYYVIVCYGWRYAADKIENYLKMEEYNNGKFF